MWGNKHLGLCLSTTHLEATIASIAILLLNEVVCACNLVMPFDSLGCCYPTELYQDEFNVICNRFFKKFEVYNYCTLFSSSQSWLEYDQ